MRLHPRLARDAGIIDCIMDGSKGFDTIVDHLLHVRLRRDVTRTDACLDLGIEHLQFLRDAGETSLVEVDQDQARAAFLYEDVRNSPANA